MRIVSGRFRGRAIVAPEGQGTRPTSDRARQALFDVIAHASFAPDLADAQGDRPVRRFGRPRAGGLSRGARFCLFVETNEEARGAIRENIEALGLFGETRVHRRSATDLGPRPASAGGPFDLAFLDPPYRLGLGEPAVVELLKGGWLSPDAPIVFERAADEPDPEIDGVEIIDARTWGAARVLFLRALSG